MSLLSKAFSLNVSRKLPSYIKFKYQQEGIFFNARLTNTDAKTTDPEKYIPVYKFPHIKLVSGINRLKYYQTVVTGIAVPISIVLNQVNVISNDTVISIWIGGLFGCGLFYSAGVFCNKFIGIIYLNESEDKAKFSYVQFWGKRKDIILPIEDITPFSEIPDRPTDFLYSKFTRFSTKETLKLSLKQGIVLDKEKFNKIFGGV